MKRLRDAEGDGNRIYAVIHGIGVAGGEVGSTPSDSVRQTARQRAHEDANVDADSITFVESAFPEADREIESAAARVGFAGAASFAASLARVCVVLHDKVLPAREGPRFWLTSRQDEPRRAAVVGHSVDGNCVYVVLEEYAATAKEPNPTFISGPEPAIFPFTAGDAAGLVRQIDRLAKPTAVRTVSDLAAQWWHSDQRNRSGRRRIVIEAGSVAELNESIQLARTHLLNRPGDRIQRSDSAKITYSPEPQRSSGKLAFVFPGSGNHFGGMGCELRPDSRPSWDGNNRKAIASVISLHPTSSGPMNRASMSIRSTRCLAKSVSAA